MRAYTNSRPGGSCEWTRYNRVTVAAPGFGLWDVAERGSVAVERTDPLGSPTIHVLFRSSGGELAALQSDDALDCPTPTVTGCNGASFGAPSLVGVDDVVGVDAVRVRDGSEERLLVVAVDDAGDVWVTRRTASGWATPVDIASNAVGEPSVATFDGDTLLAYRGGDGVIRTHTYSFADDAWSGVELPFLVRADGTIAALAALPATSMATPTLSVGRLPAGAGVVGGDGISLLALFPDATTGALRFYRRTAGGFWEERAGAFDKSFVIAGRASLEWVPATPQTPERLYMMWREASGIVFMAMTYVDDTGATVLGLNAPFDNRSLTARGFDLMFDSGVDDGLRAVLVHDAGDAEGDDASVILRPHADGIIDFEQENYSDWDVFRVYACRTLRYPNGGSGADSAHVAPVNCFPQIPAPLP